jgi:hypothetical protein
MAQQAHRLGCTDQAIVRLPATSDRPMGKEPSNKTRFRYDRHPFRTWSLRPQSEGRFLRNRVRATIEGHARA